MTNQEAWVRFASAMLTANAGRQLTKDEVELINTKGPKELQKSISKGCAEWADVMLQEFAKRKFNTVVS